MDDKKKTPSDKLKEQVEELKEQREQEEKPVQEAEEYKSKYLRALADYQNLQRRMIQDRVESGNDTKARVISSLLPFLDNLEKAEVFVKDPGLQMVKDQYIKLLRELGLEEIDLLNKEYDPYVAEAVEIIPGEKENIIVKVLEKGYKLNDKILRAAKVTVSKKG
ncbi:nucleotide exchange factor GrpE [Candidatus Roizmanbacteria bacterium]|nr:nucleotide exchange factor GrpE [Candidatus Roizmanbacteria bacterium]